MSQKCHDISEKNAVFKVHLRFRRRRPNKFSSAPTSPNCDCASAQFHSPIPLGTPSTFASFTLLQAKTNWAARTASPVPEKILSPEFTRALGLIEPRHRLAFARHSATLIPMPAHNLSGKIPKFISDNLRRHTTISEAAHQPNITAHNFTAPYHLCIFQTARVVSLICRGRTEAQFFPPGALSAAIS